MKKQQVIESMSHGGIPFPAGLSGLCTIVSSSLILDLLMYQLAVDIALRGGKVAYVDCGNTFDPYAVVKLCKHRGVPYEPVLEKIYVSRPFTAFQLNTLVDGQLQSFLEEALPEVMVFSRVSELLNSADVDARDSLVISGRVAHEIRDIARRLKIAGVITLAHARKAQLSALIEASDTAMLMEEDGSVLRLNLLKDPDEGGHCFEVECSFAAGAQLTLHAFSRYGYGQDCSHV